MDVGEGMLTETEYGPKDHVLMKKPIDLPSLPRDALSPTFRRSTSFDETASGVD